jgi:hypothetical protein
MPRGQNARNQLEHDAKEQIIQQNVDQCKIEHPNIKSGKQEHKATTSSSLSHPYGYPMGFSHCVSPVLSL